MWSRWRTSFTIRCWEPFSEGREDTTRRFCCRTMVFIRITCGPRRFPIFPPGPAIEHRDLGILAISGPGIVNTTSHCMAPRCWTSHLPSRRCTDLPVGEDMDGKVRPTGVRGSAANVAFVRSWEEIPGADGRHPPHTRLDPVAAHEALEQMIALGYIERPDENHEIAVGGRFANCAITWARPTRMRGGISRRATYSPNSCWPTPMNSVSRSACSSSCQALEMPDRKCGELWRPRHPAQTLFEQATHKVEALSHVVAE